jgi:hypothetical protein
MPGPPRQERMPFQPLQEFCNADNMKHLGRMLEIETAQLYHYQRDGIPLYRADKIACKKLGVHPGFIWKKDWVKR